MHQLSRISLTRLLFFLRGKVRAALADRAARHADQSLAAMFIFEIINDLKEMRPVFKGIEGFQGGVNSACG